VAAAGIIDHAAQLQTMQDTAGLISQLDLVISVDTSVAHLAGALGKPCWLLLPFNPDFRWGLGVTTARGMPACAVSPARSG
jgi:ADP-heptose:LPS heptosyltransferase